jgi:hypothetical protein
MYGLVQPGVTCFSLGKVAHLVYSALGLRKTYATCVCQHNVKRFSILDEHSLFGGRRMRETEDGHTCVPPFPFSHFW